MCIIHSGMAYAIYTEILIIVLLITCHSTWIEQQPQYWCEFMRNVWECEWKWHIDKVIVLYLSTTGLAHTQIIILILFVANIHLVPISPILSNRVKHHANTTIITTTTTPSSPAPPPPQHFGKETCLSISLFFAWKRRITQNVTVLSQ